MSPEPLMEPGRRSRHHHVIVSGVILLAMIATAAVLDRLSRSRIIAERVQSWDLRRFAESRERLMDRGLFLDFEDRLILEDLPRVRHSEGGVYFLGSSVMKWATRMWEVPPPLRARIANFGIGATNQEMQLQFVHHLVDQEGFLNAGPGRVHVVLGLHWSMAVDWNPETFFGSLWRRRGLYTYDRDTGIHPVALSPLRRAYLLELGRCSGFLGGMFNRAARAITTAAGISLEETQNIRDPGEVSAWARKMAGTDGYKETLDRQMGRLEELVAYLRDRGVGVTGVMLPQRRAFDALAFPAAYRRAVVKFCESQHVPLLDLSHLLHEDEFADMNHSSDAGLQKTHRALLAIAMGLLRDMNLVPEGSREPVYPGRSG